MIVRWPWNSKQPDSFNDNFKWIKLLLGWSARLRSVFARLRGALLF
jgi:hypothetical protein